MVSVEVCEVPCFIQQGPGHKNQGGTPIFVVQKWSKQKLYTIFPQLLAKKGKCW